MHFDAFARFFAPVNLVKYNVESISSNLTLNAGNLKWLVFEVLVCMCDAVSNSAGVVSFIRFRSGYLSLNVVIYIRYEFRDCSCLFILFQVYYDMLKFIYLMNLWNL